MNGDKKANSNNCLRRHKPNSLLLEFSPSVRNGMGSAPGIDRGFVLVLRADLTERHPKSRVESMIEGDHGHSPIDDTIMLPYNNIGSV